MQYVTVSGKRQTSLSSSREATESEITARLLPMFAGLPQTSVGDQSDARLHAYLVALQGCSVAALEQGIKAVLQGTANIDERWAPTPPQMSTIVRRFDAERLKARERDEVRLLPARQAPPVYVDDAAKARSRKLYEEYLASVPTKNGMRRASRAVPQPYDEAALMAELEEHRRKAPYSSIAGPAGEALTEDE